MGAKDITVNVADGMFNYRVGAIIIDSGEILMVKNSGSSFYYTIGGRIQFGESAQDAILRESFEETGLYLEIDRLAYIHENFFTMDSDGEKYHEVCLFFLMKPNSGLREMSHSSFKEDYGDVTYQWLPINNLDGIHMYPGFFKTELSKPSGGTRYFITKDDLTAPANGRTQDLMQDVVQQFIGKHNLQADFKTRYIDLVSEIGELGGEITKGTNYGKKDFETNDATALEIGDCLFSLLALCCELNIDAKEAMSKSLSKYERRFTDAKR